MIPKIVQKNKKGGVVTATVLGVGGLIIAVIVMLVVVKTLNDSKVLPDGSALTTTVTNATVGTEDDGLTIVKTIIGSDYFSSWNATLVINITGGAGGTTNATLVEGTDYTVFSGNGSIANLTDEWNNSLVTYDWIKIDTKATDSVDNLTANFTEGIDKIALKIPTILLIVAVVFLFGALVLLVRNARNMGDMGGGSSL